MRTIWHRLRGEDGIAMITALLATFVVAMLATAGFSMAQHTLNSSSQDRRGVQAIHAAEAGIDFFLKYLSTVAIASPDCAAQTQTLTTTPASSFTVTPTYFATTSGTPALVCSGSPAVPPSVPGAVLIRSVGTSSGRSRTMEGWYVLQSTPGGAVLGTGAVFGDQNVTFAGSATTYGNPDDADVYANGNFSVTGGGAINGKIEAQGTAYIGPDVKKDATSKGTLTVRGGGFVRGIARSSQADIVNNGTISGNAYYCTSWSGNGGAVWGGSKIQNCPNPAPPTVRAFPTFTYNATDWSATYSVQTFSGAGTTACTNAYNYLLGGTAAGNLVVRVTATCTLAFTGNDNIPQKGNIAIISDGPITFGNSSHFTPTGLYKIYLMGGVSSARPCATTGVQLGGNMSTPSYGGTALDALLYSPCTVTVGNSSGVLSGQVIGGTINFSGAATMTYHPMVLPGAASAGFAQQMLYRREVI